MKIDLAEDFKTTVASCCKEIDLLDVHNIDFIWWAESFWMINAWGILKNKMYIASMFWRRVISISALFPDKDFLLAIFNPK